MKINMEIPIFQIELSAFYTFFFCLKVEYYSILERFSIFYPKVDAKNYFGSH